jgi:hypothetical protein
VANGTGTGACMRDCCRRVGQIVLVKSYGCGQYESCSCPIHGGLGGQIFFQEKRCDGVGVE